MSIRDNLRDNIVLKYKLKNAQTEKLNNLLRIALNYKKKSYDNENDRLNRKLKDNNEFKSCNDYHNGAL